MPVGELLSIQTLVVLIVATIVALLLRDTRRRLLWIVVVYFLAILLGVASALAAASGFGRAARMLGFFDALLRGIALINLAAVVLFFVALRAVKVDVPRILRDLAVAFSYIALLLYLFSQYKVDIVGIVATSAVITAIIGFSLQDVLQNVMGGLALEVDRSIVPGNWVRIGDVSGLVRDISWRYAVIETRNGDLVVIPNSYLMKNQVLVQGAASDEPRERRWVYFRVDYRYMPTVVIESVTEALRREPIPGVADMPEPEVIFYAFRDSAAEYVVRYWLTDLRRDDLTDSTIRTRIFYALRRAGIPLALPGSNLFLHRGEEERALIGAPNVELRLTALKSVSIFQSLTHDELMRVAEKLIYAPFLPGEAIMVQGQIAQHLYILARGEVEVRVSLEEGATSPVAHVVAPHFMGEGGMLTGEPRRATIVAITEVECWKLEKEAFQDILRARPQIADEISQVLALRNVELMAVRDGLSEEAKRNRVRSERQSLLGRIQRFFALG